MVILLGGSTSTPVVDLGPIIGGWVNPVVVNW